MKLLSICCATLLPTGLTTAQETPAKPPTVEQIDKTGLVGRLGSPLGEVLEMEGEVFSGDETGNKGDLGTLLLKITSVAGKPRTPPLPFLFTAPDGKKIPAGTKLKFRGYETGAFVGIPRKWPKEIPLPASPGFHFESHIVILAMP